TLRAGGPAPQPTCERDADCGVGAICRNMQCMAVQVVTQEKVVEHEVAPPSARVRIDGVVLDAVSGAPISTAHVHVDSFEPVLAVDENAGTFSLWPLDAGDGLLKITASALGYASEVQAVRRRASPEPQHLVFKLSALDVVAAGVLRGAVRNAATGGPLADARVYIPAKHESVALADDASFSTTLKAGTYEVLISQRGFVTQKKTLRLRANDVVILNVDLIPARASKARR
ncbi:MAG TPA: carboxypeptidase regulatory-like domain-containing protein, partial [Myxococcota bacterium]|nr:carboxypeptidase regulatory-like domain-containing protein [Myxococcota bacterium]